MQKRMIEKIEELTLYTIEQSKMIKELRDRMDQLEKENSMLKENLNK
jgi:predicted nuclease with TOPRIM domain